MKMVSFLTAGFILASCTNPKGNVASIGATVHCEDGKTQIEINGFHVSGGTVEVYLYGGGQLPPEKSAMLKLATIPIVGTAVKQTVTLSQDDLDRIHAAFKPDSFNYYNLAFYNFGISADGNPGSGTLGDKVQLCP